ncbi:hypothetical protein [Bacillus sp. SD088]|uniref:YqgU-like beta propeller domain-containing protein n=1 Tax=Bacillus sp. SD088 TaxID=2782012 RepID=UPI001A9728D1|nr:hypothetical protein [Bacillus sp. SD088]MBO0995247.1 hypothetical protein [Bacillus sp. SD088]
MQKKFFWIFLILLVLIVLPGCTLSQNKFVSPEIEKKDPPPTSKEDEQSTPTPFQLEAGDEFEQIYGWVDDETILYAFIHKGNYQLATYQLYEGKTDVIFTSQSPFNEVVIHPDKERLLVYTSENAHSAKLDFIDLAGDVKFSTSVDSHEIAAEWNPENSNLMMITAFFEDWSYESLQLDVGDHSIQKKEGIEPFIKWFGEEAILIQEWAPDEPSVFAPLVQQSLSNSPEKETLIDHLYRFDVFSNVLMTIDVADMDSEQLEYQFFDSSLQEMMSSIQVPNLTQYTDWLIPYYDYIESEQVFLTFVPKQHGSADMYTEGFQLIAYDLSKQNEEVMFDHMENKPISCSPNWKLCLYGYQLEELINLETKDRLVLPPKEKEEENDELITAT